MARRVCRGSLRNSCGRAFCLTTWAAFTILAALLTACGISGNGADESGSIPPLPIVGDISPGTAFYAERIQGNLDPKPGDDDFFGNPLSGVTDGVTSEGPSMSGKAKEFYLVAKDGFTAMVGKDGADEIYLTYTRNEKWCIVAPKHPISTNAQDLSHIIVVADGGADGLRIKDKNGNESLITMGLIQTSPLTSSLHFEGESDKETDGKVFRSSVFTEEKSFTLGGIWDGYAGEPFTVVTTDGGKYLTDGTGRFIVNTKRNTLDYADEEGKTYENVESIELR